MNYNALAQATSSVVADALDELGLDSVLTGMTPRHQSSRAIVGRALPVKFVPREHSGADRFGGGVGRPLEAVLKAMSAGDFVVFDLNGSERAACWGGLASRMALQRGVSGVAVWGSCRDVAEIVELDFPVWSTSLSPRRSRNDFGFGTINEAIHIVGVDVAQGDLVIGDATGVVAVPQARVTDVVELVEVIMDQERRLESEVAGDNVVNWDQL